MKHAALIASALALAGCSFEQFGAGEAVGEEQQEIINGTPVATDPWGSPWFGCSSTLIRRQWAITAKHCTPGFGGTLVLKNGQSATVEKTIQHPTQDVTMVRLATPLQPSPAAQGMAGPYPIYRGAAEFLGGQNLYCQGWGANGANCGTDSEGHWTAACTGGGVCRSATLHVDQAPILGDSSNWFRLHYNYLSQIQGPADSGSSCLLTNSNFERQKMTGVDSWGVTDETHIFYAYFTSPHVFRDWATGISGWAPSLGAQAGYERSDQVDAVVYRSGSTLRELSNPGGQWIVNTLPSGVVASNPSVFVYPEGWSSIIYRDTSNRIRETYMYPYGAWQSANLSGSVSGEPPPAGDPASYVRADGASAILYRSTDNRVQEISFPVGATKWQWEDLSYYAGSLAASDPIGFVRHDATTAVIYRDVDNYVSMLWRSAENPIWSWQNLSANTSNLVQAPKAVGKPFPFSSPDNTSDVVYRTSAGEVWMLQIPASGGYPAAFKMSGNLTASKDPIGFTRSDEIATIVFQASNRHIMALYYSPGWYGTVLDLTQISGAPLASTAAANNITAYVRNDRYNVVTFRDSAGHIHELRSAWFSPTHWADTDLTQVTGGAL